MLLAAAALLIFLTGLAHSVLGERYILQRLFRRPDLPRLFGGTAFTVGTLRFAWHTTTVVWWGVGLLLAMAAAGPVGRPEALQVLAGTAALSALLPIVFTRGRHLSWLVFVAVAVLAWLAR